MKNAKVLTMAEALNSQLPFTPEEAEKIMNRLDKFYTRLRKDYGEDRFDIYTSTVQAIAHTSGVSTNLRGNMHTAQFAMATALDTLIEAQCDTTKQKRETVLLYCVTDLANEVRELWKLPPPPNDSTKVPIQQVD